MPRIEWKKILQYLAVLHGPIPPFPGNEKWSQWNMWRKFLWYARQL